MYCIIYFSVLFIRYKYVNYYTLVKFPIHCQDDCSGGSHSGQAYKLNLSLYFLTLYIIFIIYTLRVHL